MPGRIRFHPCSALPWPPAPSTYQKLRFQPQTGGCWHLCFALDCLYPEAAQPPCVGAPCIQPSIQGFPALSEVVQSCKWWDSRSASRLSPSQLSVCVSTASQQADVLLAQQCGEGGARPARGDRAGGTQCLDTLTRNKSSCVLPMGCQKQSETRE